MYAQVGYTALMLACKYDHPECAALLAEAGADLDVVTKKHWSALMFATKFGHLLCANTILEHGAGVEGATVEGTTALMLSAKVSHGPTERPGAPGSDQGVTRE